jgi:nitrogenase molybdenum-iron protein alpha/beta subunit
MGAAQKLKDLILQADTTFKTKVLFVVGTCAADIIGEDLGAVCRSMQPQVKAQLIPIMAGGFHGDTYEGMNIGLSALLPFIKNKMYLETDINTENKTSPEILSNDNLYEKTALKKNCKYQKKGIFSKPYFPTGQSQSNLVGRF